MSIPAEMRAIAIQQFGNHEELRMVKLPVPTPAADEVLMKISHAAVNPVDWKIREGYLKDLFPHHFPLIPGWDAAGTIAAIGSGVSNWQLGDAIYAYCRKAEVQWGAYAEYITLKAEHIASKPKKLSFAAAAAVPLAGLTAWQALFDAGKLSKGQSVFIHAGAGGVGGYAIQFARQAGAYVVASCGSDNIDYVKKLGAHAVIDYRNDDFLQRARDIRPEGYDVVLAAVGGDYLRLSLNITRRGGWLVSIVDPIDDLPYPHHGINAEFVFVSPNGQQLADIAALFDSGKIHPPALLELPLDRANEAQRISQSGHGRGKITLRVID